MTLVYPNYYKNFKCIAGQCAHNCCIGWEIDIDDETAGFYRSVQGDFGVRLQNNISRDEVPHFILSKDERCPFLNDRNLCDIILNLGEEHLCGICADHPRFRNELPGRVEVGLGLCCEEAARLILGSRATVSLEFSGQPDSDEIISMRDEAICLLQNRSESISHRVLAMLDMCGASLPRCSAEHWAEVLAGLERLDGKWTALLEKLAKHGDCADIGAFDRHMDGRQTEYEQLLIYFVYRHMANAWDTESLASRAAFAAFGYNIIHTLGAVMWTETGDFTFEDQVELARLFSSEIEYSDDNLHILFDLLG